MNISIKHLVAISAISLAAFQVQAAPINLNTWSQVGTPSSGNWTVSGDGSNVFQSINGSPTAFVSPESFINRTFKGSFGVETTSDDDYIGFVFGYQNTTDFLLFDWKQGLQNGSSPGFYLSHVTNLSSVPFSNHASDNSDYDVLATNLGTGWSDNTVYDFTLDYQDNLIKIIIDGGTFDNETIFNVARTNVAGNFGFYNYSQSSVRYNGFTEDISTSVPEPTSLFLLAAGLLAAVARKKIICIG